MAQQNALRLETKQGGLVLGKRPIPSPGAGDLLVKIHASGLNPIDWKIQTWNVFDMNLPVVLGAEAAGEVEQVGEGVVGWNKGDRVFFQGNYTEDRGTFQQYALVDAEIAAKIPEKITYSQAATIPVCFITAVVGLWGPKPIGVGLEASFDGKPRYTGHPALVIGGSASVGQYAIQLLRLSGFSPIITYASSRHADYLKSLGATHVIDRNSTPIGDLVSAVQKITAAPFSKVIFDAVGGADNQQAGYDLLASGGQLINLAQPILKETSEDKGVVEVRGWVHPPTHKEFAKVIIENLPKLLENGSIKPNRVEDVSGGLGGIVGGLEKIQKEQVSGIKLVAHPQE